MTKIETLIRLLKKHQFTLVTIESATCGLLASWFGNISGVSEVYFGGLVTYQTIAKTKLLNINQNAILTNGAVSAFTAKQMINKACELTGCDCAISITGVAGPSMLDNYAPGQFYVGIQIKNNTYVYFVNFPQKLNRNEYRYNIALFCINQLINLLSK